MKKRLLANFLLTMLAIPTFALAELKSVTIDWTITDTSNVTVYRMYYSSNSDMSGKTLICETADATVTSLTCSGVDIQTYPAYFTVAALKENEELESPIKSFEPTATEVTSEIKPETVQNFSLFIPENQIANITPEDIIIDNSDIDSFSSSGTWSTSSFSPYRYGDDYLYAITTDAYAEVVWSTEIVTSGNYNILAIWNSDSTRVDNATYIIENNGTQIASISVSQKVNGGEFNLIKNIELQKGTLSIKLSNDASNGTYVIADAIKIQFIP